MGGLGAEPSVKASNGCCQYFFLSLAAISDIFLKLMFQRASKPAAECRKSPTLVVALVILISCFCAVDFTVCAQDAPRSGGPAPPKTSSSGLSRNSFGRVPRTVRRVGTSRGSISEQSDRFLDLGDQLAEKGRWNAAEVAYGYATKLSPGNSDAWLALGNLFNKEGKHGDAFRPFNNCLNIDPSNAWAAYGIGFASMKLGRNGEAVNFFRRAIANKPDFSDAYFDLGLAYLALGNKQLALNQYEKLKGIDSESAEELLAEINKK